MKNVRLFNSLMRHVSNTKGKFYFHDALSPMGTLTRTFSYHFANYNDWESSPYSVEARGIMFEITDAGKPVRVMSRPFTKFWNYGEIEYTRNLDLSQVSYYMTKEDGSIISTYYDQDCLFLKSKTRMFSEHAGEATVILGDHPELRQRLTELAKAGYTVIMEYVGPSNRIVLEYSEPKLVVLGIRDTDSGEEVPIDEIYADPILRPYIVSVFTHDNINEDWIREAKQMTGIEGFILVMSDGTRVKVKTDWYFGLHKIKDSIDDNKELVACCVNNLTDDLRSIITSEAVYKKITDFENMYYDKLSTGLSRVTTFVLGNKYKDRKAYAIAANTEFKNDMYLFHSCMKFFDRQFDGEVVIEDIKAAALKHPDMFIPPNY